jgi:tRNA A37 threonylcarbamoyltransferase TsaD
LPFGLKTDQNADMSFTGLKTAISASFYVGVEDKSVPLLEREMKNLNFQ